MKCWKVLWTGGEEQLRIKQLGTKGRLFHESCIFNKVASTWKRSVVSAPSPSAFCPRLQVLLQHSPATHKWAQHRAAEQRPMGCDTWGYRAPASCVLSQASLNFPKQIHCNFRHLVTHLLPLVPSPCAT